MYYRMTHSIDEKIVGKFPQSINAAYNEIKDVDDPRFIDRIFFKKVDYDPITVKAILEKKAIPTDLISATCKGFSLKLLMSSKLRSILENARKTGLQFFHSNIIHNNKEIDGYSIMNAYEANPNFVDYNNSEIYLTKFGFQKIERIHFNSKDNFIDQTKQIKKQDADMGFLIEKLALVEDKFIDEDFFILRQVEGGVGYFVSEKLKAEIEKANCTGIDFWSEASGYSNLW